MTRSLSFLYRCRYYDERTGLVLTHLTADADEAESLARSGAYVTSTVYTGC